MILTWLYRPITSTRGPQRLKAYRRGRLRTICRSTVQSRRRLSSSTQGESVSLWYLHRCQKLFASRLSKSLESPSPISYRRLIMSVVSSATARRLSAHRELCVLIMAWMTWHCKPSLDQSLKPSWCSRLALGSVHQDGRPAESGRLPPPQQAMRLLPTRPANFWRDVQEIWRADFPPGHWKPKPSPIWYVPPPSQWYLRIRIIISGRELIIHSCLNTLNT